MSLKIVRLGDKPAPRRQGTAPKASELDGEPVVDLVDAEPAPEQRANAAPEAVADADMPTVTGPLSPLHTPKLFMELFVGERSGRLLVDGTLQAAVYFYAGEPVHVATADQGAQLERRLAARGPLLPLARAVHPKAKSPIGMLSRRSSPLLVLEALRDETRELCRSVLAMPMGAFAFYDGEGHLDSVPWTAVSSFALVMEHRRRTLDPLVATRMVEQVQRSYPAPRTGFANVSARLKQFTAQVDLADVVDGTRSGAEICRLAGIDGPIGALMLATLADCAVLQLAATPKTTPERDTRGAVSHAYAGLVQADARQLATLSSSPARGGSEILALYCELKPEPDPDVVLGLEGSAGAGQVERLYQQRIAELDTRAIPQGPNHAYLTARAEELRAKVERAYEKRMSTKKARAAAAYEVFDRIGTGGMAEVFLGRARDNPDQLVAIKVILPELRADASFSQMFLEEARLARRIQHKNVVRIFTVGKSTDDLYLAMEFVDGLDFGDLVKRGREQKTPVPVDVACKVLAEACAGLHAAHNARDRLGNPTPILHRDVSPQNILVSRMGDVKLSDFGIAKATDSLEEDKKTVKGKIPFLSPELLMGDPASPASDVYAMAMTMYAVIGRLPFSRGDTHGTMTAILHDPLPPLSTYGPVPSALDTLFARAAAKDPKARHATAEELQHDLERYLATRPPVDVGAWARPLAGRRRSNEKGVMPTSAGARPITSNTGRPITSSSAITSSRPITSSTSTTSRPPTSPGQPLTPASSPPVPAREESGRVSRAPSPVVLEGSGAVPRAPAEPLPRSPSRVIGGGEAEDVDVDDF